MPNLDQTGSYTKVQQHADTDKYCRIGNGVMVRQFDTSSVVINGGWTELWLGFRYRISCSYELSGSLTDAPWSEEIPGMEIGICNTAGPVYGQSGSGLDFSNQHALGIETVDWSVTAGWAWALEDTGSHTYLTREFAAIHWYTGSYQRNSTGGLTTRTNTNSLIDSSSYRSVGIIRFYTGSAGQDQLAVGYLWRNLTNVNDEISASSQLANILTGSTWSASSVEARSLGYTDGGGVGSYTVSQSVYGYLDGVYVSWHRMYDTFELSDIVVRTIP